MEVPLMDNGKNNVSSDLRFASALAVFAQILKNLHFKADATYGKVLRLVETAKSINKKSS